MNPVIEEIEILATLLLVVGCALFRIDSLGTISFKDTAPNPNSPNDSDANGEYLITITVTDKADGFTQDIEYVLAFPDWNDNRSYATDAYPTLDPDQQMLVIPEGQFMGRTGYFDEDLGKHVDVYKGIKLNVTGLDDSTSWLELRHFDDQGNPIKDNRLFDIYKDPDDGFYYLSYRGDGGQSAFDFEAPKDANGDNVYELFIILNDYGSGTDVSSSVEMIVVVTDSQTERPVSFEGLNEDGFREINDGEYTAPVANLTTIEKNGKTLESYFVSGDAGAASLFGNTPYQDELNNQVLQTFTESTPFVVTVTGGPGSFRYLIDGVEGGSVSLREGGTYTFDISDSSNATHPFRFSETQDGTWNGGTEYISGVTYNGTPGEAGATVTITLGENSPDLFYYCAAHANQGGGSVQTLFGDFRSTGFTTDELLAAKFGGETVTTITGGADADLFYVFRSDGYNERDLILFKTRPEFSNPSDANGDNVYEIQLTKTDSAGNTTVATLNINVTEAQEGKLNQ